MYLVIFLENIWNIMILLYRTSYPPNVANTVFFNTWKNHKKKNNISNFHLVNEKKKNTKDHKDINCRKQLLTQDLRKQWILKTEAWRRGPMELNLMSLRWHNLDSARVFKGNIIRLILTVLEKDMQWIQTLLQIGTATSLIRNYFLEVLIRWCLWK